MHQHVLQQRSSRIELGGQSWISRLAAQMFAHRRRRPSMEPLPDYLLRDAGLERIGGVTRRRLR